MLLTDQPPPLAAQLPGFARQPSKARYVGVRCKQSSSTNIISQGELYIFFHCCLNQAGTSPASFALRIQTLGKYHARNIHQWEQGECMGGECGFHRLFTCSCGKCEDEIECEGKPYHTKPSPYLSTPCPSIRNRMLCKILTS